MNDFIELISNDINVSGNLYLKGLVFGLFILYLYLPLLTADFFKDQILNAKRKVGYKHKKLLRISIALFLCLLVLIGLKIRNVQIALYFLFCYPAVTICIMIFRQLKVFIGSKMERIIRRQKLKSFDKQNNLNDNKN